MGRRFIVTFEGVAVTAPQDLVTIKAGSLKFARLLRTWVMATTTILPTAQMLQLRNRSISSGTLSLGSGGALATPVAVDVGDAAAAATGRVNDTTKATGMFVTQWQGGCHVYQGLDLVLSEPIIVSNGAGIVFELLSTVSGTLNLSGGMLFEEMG